MKLPAEILDDRIAIVGTSGSGKSTTAKLGVERLLSAKARLCIVDPTGAWWGLRSSADGKGSGFPITIFGGEHGDLPLNDRAGKLLGETVGEGDFSCILDLTSLNTMRKRREFMKDFAEALYMKNRDPLHLILDEADLWAPQKPLEDVAAILGARIDEIVRRGRLRGFCPWLISQRPAVIHKDVLSQLDTLIAMKLTSSQDRDALGAWIEGQADKAETKRIYALLPGFQKGQGLIWSPGHGLLVERQFDMPATFDSMKAPKRGERIKAPKERAAVDLDALRVQLAEVEKEAAENDPKALRAEIAKLKREAGAAPQGPTQADLDTAYQRGHREGFAAAHSAIGAATTALTRIDRMIGEVHDSVEDFMKACAELPTPQSVACKPVEKNNIGSTGPSIPARNARPAPREARASPGVTGPQQRIIDALLWAERMGLGALARTRLAFLADASPKSSTFANNLGALRSGGMIDYRSGDVFLTEQGRAAANEPGLPRTDAELHASIKAKLPSPQGRILDALIDAYPKPLSKETLADQVGASVTSSTFANNLGAMRSLGVLDYPTTGQVVATDILFLGR